ncbi:MAG: sigma-70 family RNA polymerase sigma factor [Candidatus Hydrogenedentes bacterium]|nr:sigma-70 family RNA polymerase sigma factor [Candidatus Hydrogenedentota bacterium]
MNDIELWNAWRNHGNADAFATLVERYLGMVHATARRVLGNAHDAEEVAQECFITLLKGRVNVQDPIGPWLHRVARNRALDRLKSELRRRERERFFEGDGKDMLDAGTEEILAQVDAAIDALPAALRAAIVGRFLEGKTNQALGESLGVAESTIRLRVHKGVERIRETLKHRGVLVTVAALGSVLENNMAGAAPAELRHAVVKLALAAPAPASYPPAFHVALPKAAALIGAALLVVCYGAYVTLSGNRAPAVRGADGAGGNQAEVTVSTVALTTPAMLAPTVVTQPVSLGADSTTPAPQAPQEESAPAPEEPVSTVSGVVYDDRGYPLPGAQVTVAARSSFVDFDGMQVFTTLSAEDGSYTVSGVHHHLLRQGFTEIHRSGKPVVHSSLQTFEAPIPLGVLHVHASAEGYQSTGEQHPVEPGSHATDIDFTLEPGITMHGRLVWPDRRPAANAGIAVRHFKGDLGDYGHADRALCATGKDGSFQLGLPSTGMVWLMAVTADGTPAFFEGVSAREGEIALLTMAPVAALSGSIIGSDGRPLSGAHIALDGRFGLVDAPAFSRQVESSNAAEIAFAYMHGVYTDTEGYFSFGALAAVPDAIVRIDAPAGQGNAPNRRLLTRHLGPLQAGKETRLDIVLPGENAVMKLAVRVIGEQSGEPLPFTSVQALNVDTQDKTMLPPGIEEPYYPVERTLTQPGTYLLWPQYNNRGWTDERAEFGQEVQWAPGSTSERTFRIPDPFALSVLVVESDGSPIAEANVECVGDGSAIRTVQTDAEGRLRWNGFAPNAPAYFSISKPGYTANETLAITGVPAMDYPEETVVLHRAGGVEGSVTGVQGAPLTDTHIELRFTARSVAWLHQQERTGVRKAYIQTDAEGGFVWLEDLPAVPGSLMVLTTEEKLHSGAILMEVEPGAVLQLGTLALLETENTGDPESSAAP